MMRLDPALAETQPAKPHNFGWIDALAANQHVEGLAHSRWSHQMLELQRNFGRLLQQSAVFESVCELILLADSHQKL